MGFINKFESFGSVDGPGIRFVVFMQGCPLRCLYCHNPETWDFKKGTEISASALLKKALRYKMYWGNDGGITVSGGEPLGQIDFLIEFFMLAKKENIHTCIDTSGFYFSEKNDALKKFIELTDLFLVDIKHIQNEMCKKITGHSNENTLKFFEYLSACKKDVWVRYVLVPEFTDSEDALNETKKYLAPFKNIKRIDVLPYHTFALAKYDDLKMEYPLKNTLPPTKENLEFARKILTL